MVRDGVWEASIKMPVVGHVAVTDTSWEKARLSLWLIASAVELLQKQSQQGPQPADWTEAEWRSVLSTMNKVMTK